MYISFNITFESTGKLTLDDHPTLLVDYRDNQRDKLISPSSGNE